MADVKRLAAEILGVGESRIWIDPSLDLSAILTKDDVRREIERGTIRVKPKRGTSRARARELKEKRKKGHRRGPGSRRGKKSARIKPKKEYVKRIRAIRKILRMLRDEGKITRSEYRKYYLMAKGGYFRSKRHVLEHLGVK